MRPFDIVTSPLPPGLTLLEASAGTGKTYTISRLAVRLLLEPGLTIRDLLVVTFTRAATAELAERIRAALREAHDQPDAAPWAALIDAAGLDLEAARARLAQALREADLLGVTTIHAFAKRTLEDAAFESRQPFATTLLTDEDDLIDAALRDRWRTVLAESPWLATVAAVEGWSLDDDRDLWKDFNRFPATTCLHGLDLTEAEAAVMTAHDAVLAAWDAPTFLAATAAATWTKKAPAWLADEAVRAATFTAAAEEPSGPSPVRLRLLRDLAGLDDVLGKRSKAEKQAREVVLALPVVMAATRFLQATADLRRAWRTALLQALPEVLRAAKTAALTRTTDDLLRTLGEALPDADAPLAHRLRERSRVVLIDEFQDTDPVQWRVFSTAFGSSPDHRLILVGDPKQAIYGFRGGDSATYTAAAHTVPPAQRWTLGTNFRSEPPLLAEVNACFAAAPDPVFVDAEPAFQPVAPGHRGGQLVGWDGPRLRFWDATGLAKAGHAERVATRLVHLLVHERPRLVKDGVERPLAPGDIAVLVATNTQTREVQDACRARGLPAIVARSGDVLSGDEAEELARVFAALLAPRRTDLVRSALATRLLGRTAADLQVLEADPAAWDACATDLAELGALLVRRGPFPVLDRLLVRAEGLRARPDAARRVTDLRHLGELAQARFEDGNDAAAVVRWLSGGGADEAGQDERQRRLEGDAAAIQITKLHSSKGLQWPVVVCPYLSEPPRTDGRDWVVARRPEGGVLDLAPDDLARAEARRAQVAEQTRLVYVALTRAEHLCLALAGIFPRSQADSALAWLLRPQEQAVWGHWLAEPRLRSDLPLESLPEADDEAYTAPASLPTETSHTPLPVVPAAQEQTSFSRLTRDQAGDERGEDHDPEPPEPTITETPVLAEFPRGTTAGTALHACLEHWNLAEPTAETTLAHHLAAHAIAATHAPAVAQLQRDLAASCIPGLGTLTSLATRPLRAELRFVLACGAIDGAGLARVFAAHGQATYARRLARLPHRALAGFCVGAIDLVLSDHQDRWWVVDWKSNRLDRPLDLIMEEHHYYLQAQLYLVALHRLLGQRLMGYDPACHLGGWAYAFLRGIVPGAESGWLAAAADPALTADLDALLGNPHG